ncbi:MAG: hypothetical protein NTX44_00395 [Ignavibacteriales bacterium]|nr:hypothetical protein [Ignavibacteriales bacterium]
MKLHIPKQPILDELQKLVNEHSTLLDRHSEIELNLHAVEEKINSLKDAYKTFFGEEPSILLPSSLNSSLGDFLEIILKENNTLEINRAIELLREKRVKLSLNNPRNVLANLVKKDKKKRFTRLEDGRISLRETK